MDGAAPQTKRNAFIIDTLVREYAKYATWCHRTSSLQIPLTDWAASVCKTLDFDVRVLVEAYERRARP